MRPILIIAVCLGLVIFHSCKKDTDIDKEKDRIEIISVSPSMDLEDGVAYNFIVETEYDIVTINSGILMIGFNTEVIDSYKMLNVANVIFDKGSGVHTFNVTAIAKDWKSTGDFKVYVNLSENPHPPSWAPLASDTMVLNFSE